MTTNRLKYPRTFHAPWTLEKTADDKTHSPADMQAMFEGREVVVTEKLDGENTTIYPDGTTHARSLDSAFHPSRAWIRKFAAEVGYQIPEGWRLCGENMFALHSIGYDKLPSYFMLFHIFNEANDALSWDEVEEYAEMLGCITVPVLWRGIYDEEAIKACWSGISQYGTESEGYVIRVADRFSFEDFGRSTAKMVRAGHVQTDEHWMDKAVVPNGVIDG